MLDARTWWHGLHSKANKRSVETPALRPSSLGLPLVFVTYSGLFEAGQILEGTIARIMVPPPELVLVLLVLLATIRHGVGGSIPVFPLAVMSIASFPTLVGDLGLQSGGIFVVVLWIFARVLFGSINRSALILNVSCVIIVLQGLQSFFLAHSEPSGILVQPSDAEVVVLLACALAPVSTLNYIALLLLWSLPKLYQAEALSFAFAFDVRSILLVVVAALICRLAKLVIDVRLLRGHLDWRFEAGMSMIFCTLGFIASIFLSPSDLILAANDIIRPSINQDDLMQSYFASFFLLSTAVTVSFGYLVFAIGRSHVYRRLPGIGVVSGVALFLIVSIYIDGQSAILTVLSIALSVVLAVIPAAIFFEFGRGTELKGLWSNDT